MTLADRSRALVERIDRISMLPLAVRVMKAEELVREAADLLFGLSIESERASRDFELLRSRLKRLEALTGHVPEPGVEVPADA